jgi:hypothetical protein
MNEQVRSSSKYTEQSPAEKKEIYDNLAGSARAILTTAQNYLTCLGEDISDEDLEILLSLPDNPSDEVEASNSSLVQEFYMFQVDMDTGAFDNFLEHCDLLVAELSKIHPELCDQYDQAMSKKFKKVWDSKITILKECITVIQGFLEYYDQLYPPLPDLANAATDSKIILEFLSHENVPELQKIRVIQEIIFLRVFDGRSDMMDTYLSKQYGKHSAANSLPNHYHLLWRDGCALLGDVYQAVLQDRIRFDLPTRQGTLPGTGVKYYVHKIYSRKYEHVEEKDKQRIIGALIAEMTKIEQSIAVLSTSITSKWCGETLITHDMSNAQSRNHNRQQIALYFVDYWKDTGETSAGIVTRLKKLSQLIQIRNQYSDFIAQHSAQ